MTIYKLIAQLVRYAENSVYGGNAEVLIQFEDNDPREAGTFVNNEGRIIIFDA